MSLPNPTTERTDPCPDGYHYERVPEPAFGCMAWRIVDPDESKRCTRLEAGERCPNQSVAKLQRGRIHLGVREQWWHYCTNHMYGRRVDGRRVWVIHVIPDM